MAKFNGHASWNAWNVSLWINNDEGLYRMALRCIADAKTMQKAAEHMFRLIRSEASPGAPKTPDGAPYSVTTIRAAMRGM